MNLRSLWSSLSDKPTSDALDYITKRINLIWLREHAAEGAHVFPTGVWTPTIGGTGGQSGQTYAQQNGFYVQAGQMVHAACRVQLSALGTITGTVRIQGLPFPAINAIGYRASAPVVWANTTSAYTNIVALVQTNARAIDLFGTAGGGATTNLSAQSLVQADLSATTRFLVSVVYEAEV